MKQISCDRISFGQIASHSNALRALTGEKQCDFSWHGA
jgi:hypothetical protein